MKSKLTKKTQNDESSSYLHWKQMFVLTTFSFYIH